MADRSLPGQRQHENENRAPSCTIGNIPFHTFYHNPYTIALHDCTNQAHLHTNARIMLANLCSCATTGKKHSNRIVFSTVIVTPSAFVVCAYLSLNDNDWKVRI